MPSLTFMTVVLQCLPLLVILCIHFGEKFTTARFHTRRSFKQSSSLFFVEIVDKINHRDLEGIIRFYIHLIYNSFFPQHDTEDA